MIISYPVTQDLKELIEAVRTAPSEGERRASRERLAGELRRGLVGCLRREGADSDLAEEIAQEKTVQLLDYLAATEAPHPDALVRRAARNALFDHYRRAKRSGVHDSIDRSLEETEEGPRRDPLGPEAVRRWENEQAAEREIETKETLARLVPLLHEDDRTVLKACYYEGRSIEELAHEELRNEPLVLRGPSKGEPRTLTQARATVDQRLTRARQKLALLARKERLQ